MQPEQSHTKASQGNDYVSPLNSVLPFRLVHFHKLAAHSSPGSATLQLFQKGTAWHKDKDLQIM